MIASASIVAPAVLAKTQLQSEVEWRGRKYRLGRDARLADQH